MKQLLFLVLGLHLICFEWTLANRVRPPLSALRLRRQGEHAHQHVKIRNIDVQCSNAGLSVSVDFDGPFNGIIYSKGHFGNQKCRYLRANSGSRSHTFSIPGDDCGTENAAGTRSNVLIFQMDETIQEVWDVARKVSCDSANGVRTQGPRKHGKTVVFKPLNVGMLDVQHQPFKSEGLNCWMDIQLGHFPNTSPIAGQVKIGEELSVIIYLKDDKKMYDVGVKDCWAFNNDDFDHPATSKVQLTDADGCVKKSKLIGNWKKTYEPGDSGATTIAYTNMTAFKFPDSDNVHLTCNIEVCEDYCEETCASNSGAVLPTRGSIIGGPKPTSSSYTKFEPDQTTTRPPICYPNNFDPRCPKETQVATFPASEESEAEVLPGGQSTRRPLDEYEEDIQPGGYTTKKPLCYPGQIDPRCEPMCYPGTTDKRCYEEETDIQPGGYTTRKPFTTYPTTFRTTPAPYTTKKPLCYPGQIDPRCPPVCTPGSTDKRCNEEEEDIQPGGYTTRPTTTYRTTPRPVITYPTTPRTYATTTTRKPLCYPGQIDPRCPPVCTPGSTDKRCNEEEEDIQPGGYTTRRPFTYPTTTYRTTTPYATTARTFATTKKPLCYPGQIDPRCPPVCTPGSTDKRCNEEEEDIQPGGYTTQKPFTYPTTTYRTTTQPPRTYPTTTQTSPFQCYPGSLDFRCLRSTTSRTTYPTTTYRTTPRLFTTYPTTFRTTQLPYTTTKKPLCYPGQIDPRCPPVCTPGSTDPRCNESEEDIQPGGYTTRRPFTYPTTTYRPTTTTYRTTARTFATTKKPLCYPGQIDPRCPPVCTPGSTDKRCQEEEEDIQPGGYTTRRPTTYPTTTYRTTTRPTTTYTTTQAPRTYPTTRRTTQYQCYPGSLDYRCLPQTTTLRPYTTTKKPLCYPGQIDPRCPPVCTPGSTDPRCNESEEDIQPGGYTTKRPLPTTTYRTTTQPPRTFPTTSRTTPFQCYPGSLDRRCLPQTTTPRPYTTTKKPLCYPGQIDPRCPPVCTPGSSDPRCNEEEEDIQPGGYTTRRPFTYPTTTYQTTPRPTTARTFATTKKPLCYPGQIDPRCPPICTPGSTDKRCPTEEEEDIQPGGYTTRRPTTTYRTTPRPIITTQPPRTYPSTTTKKPLCYPGQIDPRCPPVCTPGSTDPRCNESEEDIQPGGYTTSTTTRRPSTTPSSGYVYSAPKNQLTYPENSDDSQSDLKSSASIDRQVKTLVAQTVRGPICYKGSFDPRCPKSAPRAPPPRFTAYRDYDDEDDHQQYLGFESKKISAEYF